MESTMREFNRENFVIGKCKSYSIKTDFQKDVIEMIHSWKKPMSFGDSKDKNTQRAAQEIMYTLRMNAYSDDLIEGFSQLLMSGIEEKEVELIIVHRKDEVWFENYAPAMEKAGYRSATFVELLTLGAQYPNLEKDFQQDFRIVAMGSIAQVNGEGQIMCIGTWDGIRGIELMPFNDHYANGYCYAFVKKDSAQNDSCYIESNVPVVCCGDYSLAGPFVLTVDYDKTAEDLIAAGKFNCGNKFELQKRYAVNKSDMSGKKDIEIFLARYYDNQRSVLTLISEMDKKGFRPSTRGELISLGAYHPEMPHKNYPIFALISTNDLGFSDGTDDVCISAVIEWAKEDRRELSFETFNDEVFGAICRFAFTRIV